MGGHQRTDAGQRVDAWRCHVLSPPSPPVLGGLSIVGPVFHQRLMEFCSRELHLYLWPVGSVPTELADHGHLRSWEPSPLMPQLRCGARGGSIGDHWPVVRVRHSYLDRRGAFRSRAACVKPRAMPWASALISVRCDSGSRMGAAWRGAAAVIGPSSAIATYRRPTTAPGRPWTIWRRKETGGPDRSRACSTAATARWTPAQNPRGAPSST